MLVLKDYRILQQSTFCALSGQEQLTALQSLQSDEHVRVRLCGESCCIDVLKLLLKKKEKSKQLLEANATNM